MFSLRRLAVSAGRARTSSTSLSPSTFAINYQSRPKNLSELRKFESLLQRRWNSAYDSENFREQDGGEDQEGGARFRKIRHGYRNREPRGLPSEPTKVIYVGNLKYEVTEAEIEEKFKEFGRIIGIKIPRTNDTGIARGFAYVEYGELSEAAEAIEACHQTPFGGRRLNCQYVHRTDFRIRANPESTTLFVGNMSFNTTEEDLAELFKGITGCVDVRVAIDQRTNQPRGFVHADFQDVESAVKAKEKLQGVQLYGRRIRVDFSSPPEDRKQQMAEAQSQRQRNLAFEDLMAKRKTEGSDAVQPITEESNSEEPKTEAAEQSQTEEGDELSEKQS